jgi:hypothetical protein
LERSHIGFTDNGNKQLAWIPTDARRFMKKGTPVTPLTAGKRREDPPFFDHAAAPRKNVDLTYALTYALNLPLSQNQASS